MGWISSDCLGVLWRISWQAALLAAIVWSITRFAKNAPARLRHALWVVVLVKFFIPPFAYLPSEFVFWQHGSIKPQWTSAAIIPELPQVSVPTQTNGPGTTIPSSVPKEEATAPPASASPIGTRDILFLLWLAGAGAMAMLLLLRAVSQRRLLTGAAPADELVIGLFSDAAHRMAVRRVPGIRVSEKASTPMLVGLFAPVVLLPPSLADRCGQADLRAMLLHELAHIKRWDMLILWLQQLAQVVFFFHPATWLAGRELRRERELACDELVLRASGMAAKDYAAGYVAALKLANHAAAPTALAMAEPFEAEKKRIDGILRSTRARLSTHWIVALLLVAVIGLPTFIGCTSGASRVAPTGLAKSPWPKFGGNAQNTNRTPVKTVIGPEIWHAQVPGGLHQSSPAIGPDGTVYLSTMNYVVLALDGLTGAKKWSTSVAGFPVWDKFTDGLRLTHKINSIMTSSPAVAADGTVYVGSPDKRLYAIDGKTGRKKWDFKTGGRIFSSPTITQDGKVIFDSYDENVYALDTVTGAEIWRFASGGQGCYSPALAGGIVYVSTGFFVYALDIQTGRQVWKYKTTGGSGFCSVGSNGTVYVGAHDNKLYALDGRTGRKKWEFATRGVVWPCPAVGADGTVYAGSWDHRLYAINARTGKKKWVYDTGDIVARPAIITSDGSIYLSTVNNGIHILDAKTGQKRNVLLAGKHCEALAIGDDILYFYASDGMHAFMPTSYKIIGGRKVRVVAPTRFHTGVPQPEALRSVLDGTRAAAAAIKSGKGTVTLREWYISAAGNPKGAVMEFQKTYHIAFSDDSYRLSLDTTLLRNDPRPGPGIPNKPGYKGRREIAIDKGIITHFMDGPGGKRATIGPGKAFPSEGGGFVMAHRMQSPAADIELTGQQLPGNGIIDVPSLRLEKSPLAKSVTRKLAGSELVDGSRCMILEIRVVHNRAAWPNYLIRLWIDPNKGFAVPIFRWYNVDRTSGKRTMARESRTWLKEYGSGVWCPGKVIQSCYSVDRRGKLYKDRSTTITYERDFQVNVPITDEELKLDLPPGTRVYDEASKSYHTVPVDN